MTNKLFALISIFIILLSFNATAESTTTTSKTTATTTTTSSIGDDVGKALDERGTGSDNSTDVFAGNFEKWYADTMLAFGSVEGAIKNSQNHFSYLNVKDIASFLIKIFMPLGYAVLFMSWCLTMGKKGIMLDLYEPKDFIKCSGTLIMGMMLISLSTVIMELIFAITNGITVEIINQSGKDIFTNMSGFDLVYKKSNLWLIGPIITFFNLLSTLPTALLWALFNFIICIIIEVVLFMRLIKIAIFQGVSPLMIGLFAGEATSPYAKNFIVEYLKLTFQGVIIAIVYYVYKKVCINGLGAKNFYNAMVHPDTIWTSMLYPVMLLSLALLVLNSGKLLDKIVGRA